MEFKQAPLVDVFRILGQLGGYNVLVIHLSLGTSVLYSMIYLWKRLWI